MSARGIQEGAVEAVMAYLAFFVGHLVNSNSMLCHWDRHRQAAGTALARHAAIPHRVFVERNPVGFLNQWLSTVVATFKACEALPRAATVRLADAANLPFQDDYFDAIVTDPPYYDSVQYAELASYFWVWESWICPPIESSFGRAAMARAIETKRGDDANAYREGHVQSLA